MKIKIHFSNILADKYGEFRILDTRNKGDHIGLNNFINLLKTTPWGNSFIDDNYIKSPYILIIDDQLIQSKTDSKIIITERSKIYIQIMFAGG